MTMPKKGTRKITVDGVVYRWVVRRQPTYNQEGDTESRACIEAIDFPKGTVLTVVFPWPRYDSCYHFDPKVISPKRIALSIQKSLVQGWQPEVSGATFVYHFEEDEQVKA